MRYLYLTAAIVAVVGIAGRFLAWPTLTTTIGPTAYVFAAHPHSETSRLRNAVLGHATAIGVGLGCLAVFGLWTHPSISALGEPTGSQVAAAAVAVGLTLFPLELMRSHHAPAAATSLLVVTGLAKPGKPLLGLVVGLACVVALGPLCRWTPLARNTD